MSLTLLFNAYPAPANSLAIVNNANTTVGHVGYGAYWVTKTGGADSTYDADAVSSVGIPSDFILRLLPLSAGLLFSYGGGVSASPTASSSYTTVDFMVFVDTIQNWGIYESGVQQATGAATGTYHWIWRTGSALGYGHGATLATAQASPDRTTTSTGTVYFDSSFFFIGNKLEALLYLPQDLVGTSSLTFSPSATATGKGALSGTAALTFTPVATATGLGALSGITSLTFSPTSTLTGKGDLSGTTSLTFGPTATATGKGALSGSSSLAFAPAGSLTGPGALSGASALIFAASATATGAGALSGASSFSFAPSATITGTGALSGTSTLTFGPTATLTGSGALSGVASVTFAPVGTLSGIVYITGVATLGFTVVGTLTAINIIQDAKATRRLRESQRRYTDKTGVWR